MEKHTLLEQVFGQIYTIAINPSSRNIIFDTEYSKILTKRIFAPSGSHTAGRIVVAGISEFRTDRRQTYGRYVLRVVKRLAGD